MNEEVERIGAVADIIGEIAATNLLALTQMICDREHFESIAIAKRAIESRASGAGELERFTKRNAYPEGELT